MQQEKKDTKGSLLYVEGRGLASCNVIVEMYTDRPKRARQEVQSVLKKFGYLLLSAFLTPAVRFCIIFMFSLRSSRNQGWCEVVRLKCEWQIQSNCDDMHYLVPIVLHTWWTLSIPLPVITDLQPQTYIMYPDAVLPVHIVKPPLKLPPNMAEWLQTSVNAFVYRSVDVST